MAVVQASPAICQSPQPLIFSITPRRGCFPFALPSECSSGRFSLPSLSTSVQFACRASRRITNNSRRESILEERGNFEEEEGFEEEEYYYDDDDEEEEDRSLDLLARFIQNIFKKMSKRARKATSAILPSAISPQLVAFSVNGTIILTFLSILKAFLEVICTLGSAVFAAILLLRLIWSAITYMQINGQSINFHGVNDNSSYSASQPAT